LIASLSIASAAFAALTVALAALWVNRAAASRVARHLWLGAGAVSLVLALAAGMLDVTALAALAIFAAVCILARRSRQPAVW